MEKRNKIGLALLFLIGIVGLVSAGISPITPSLNLNGQNQFTLSNYTSVNNIYYAQAGVTDDIAAKAALCGSSGCKIIILEGTHTLTSMIDTSAESNINFECVSHASIINGSGLPTYTMWLGNNSGVSNCYFVGNDTQTSNTLRMESNVIIRDNYFYDGGGIVYANNQEYSTVENNYWYASYGDGNRDIHGIFLSHNANNNRILNNDIVGEFQRGMYILNTQNNVIKGNFISGNLTNINTVRGIYVQWGNEFTVIEDNYIENIYYTGISIEQADSGIYGWNLDNVIRGNVIRNTGSSGILINGQNNLTLNTIIEGNKLYDTNTGISVSGGANTTGTIVANNFIQGIGYDAIDLSGSGSSAFNNQFLDDAQTSGDIVIGSEITDGTAKIFNYDPNTDNIWNNLPFKSFTWGNWTSTNIPASDNISALTGSSLRLFPNGALDAVKCINDGREGDVMTLRAKYDTGNIRLYNNDSQCSADAAIHFVNENWNQSTISTSDINDFFTCRMNGDDGWYCDVSFHDKAKLNEWTTLSNYPSACPAGSYVTQIDDSITCTSITSLTGLTELTTTKLGLIAWDHETLPASDNLTYSASLIKVFPSGSLDTVQCVIGGVEGDTLKMRAKYVGGNIRYNNNDSACSLGEEIHFKGEIWNDTTVTTESPFDTMSCINYGSDDSQYTGWWCEMSWYSKTASFRDINPKANALYSFGTSALRWLKGWFVDVDVSGLLNNTGNALINNYHAEIFAHNDTSFWTVTINTQDVWVNVTINSTGTHSESDLNGFTYDAATSSLTPLIDGKFDCSYDASFGNVGNNQEYQLSLAVNGVLQEGSDSHRKIGTGGDVGDIGDRAWIDMSSGDMLQLQAVDREGTSDLQFHSASINCLRIHE